MVGFNPPVAYKSRSWKGRPSFSLPLSLVWGERLVYPLKERAALPVSVQSTGKELPRLSVFIIPLKYRGGACCARKVICLHGRLGPELTMGTEGSFKFYGTERYWLHAKPGLCMTSHGSRCVYTLHVQYAGAGLEMG